MYKLQIYVNKSFGAKHLRQYTKDFHPTNETKENIAGWILSCLQDYKDTVLKDQESLPIQFVDMIRNIQVVRNDSVVVISTATDFYLDIFSLGECLIEYALADFKQLMHSYELMCDYLQSNQKE